MQLELYCCIVLNFQIKQILHFLLWCHDYFFVAGKNVQNECALKWLNFSIIIFIGRLGHILYSTIVFIREGTRLLHTIHHENYCTVTNGWKKKLLKWKWKSNLKIYLEIWKSPRLSPLIITLDWIYIYYIQRYNILPHMISRFHNTFRELLLQVIL
mgnify:CR=1 FL=1